MHCTHAQRFLYRNCSRHAFLMYEETAKGHSFQAGICLATQLLSGTVCPYNLHVACTLQCHVNYYHISKAFPLYGTLGLPIYLLLTNMVLEFVIGWLFSKTQSTSAFFLRILLYFIFCGTTKRIVKFRILWFSQCKFNYFC